MKVKVILNPYANRWRAKALAPEILAICRRVGLDADMVQISAAGMGIREARLAASGEYGAVIAAGGDGTLNEVVNGLIEASQGGPTIPLGVLPLGTSNDFSDMAGLPRDLELAAQIVANGQTRQVDAGRITVNGNVRYFDNNSALAMEPMVTIENIRMTSLSGDIRYLAALLKCLARLASWPMHLEWDGGSYEGPVVLLSVCNTPRTGGLFHMAPGARMDDGLFDFVYAPDLSLVQVIGLIPRLLRGTHVEHKRVVLARSSRLSIRCEIGSPIHADGEILSETARQITYDMLPGKITLLAG